MAMKPLKLTLLTAAAAVGLTGVALAQDLYGSAGTNQLATGESATATEASRRAAEADPNTLDDTRASRRALSGSEQPAGTGATSPTEPDATGSSMTGGSMTSAAGADTATGDATDDPSTRRGPAETPGSFDDRSGYGPGGAAGQAGAPGAATTGPGNVGAGASGAGSIGSGG